MSSFHSNSPLVTAADPLQLHLKALPEAAATIAEMRRTDRGLLPGPHAFYLLYAAMAIAALMHWMPGVWVGVALLGVDFATFVVRRGRALRRFESNPRRLRTSADSAAVDVAYEVQGKQQPTMADWIAAAKLAGRQRPRRRALQENDASDSKAGPTTASTAGTTGNEERYLDIARAVRALPRQPRVVVDVGANDGCACWQYGIGRESLFMGIDISFQLLQQMRAHLPQQGAVLADGGCLPLRDASADFMFCSETLEHLPDPDAAVAEFARVLRAGGHLMIQSPNAHRLRNLNLLHVVALLVGLVTDRVLLKKTVHENTWHNAATYHWDFSLRDYRRMTAGYGLRVVRLSSCGFFVPRSLLLRSARLERLKERALAALPVVRYFGEDLVLVAERLDAPGVDRAESAG